MTTPIDSQETLIWRGTPSNWTNFGTYFFCLLLAAGVVAGYYFVTPPRPLILLGLVVPVLWILVRWLAIRCHRYEITTGLLSRKTNELELYRVRDYSVDEPFWLRLVGCGNVVLVTSDRTTPSFVLRAVPHAATLKDQIRTHTERMRQRRGVRELDLDPPASPPPQ